MREADFLQQFLHLLNADVLGLNLEQKSSLFQTLCHKAQQVPGKTLPTCRIVSFITGRRPIDEAAHTLLDVCDTRRYGSLYQRIVERLLKPDTEQQARRAGVAPLDVSFHLWFPVLKIGSDKAGLYTDALVEDIVHKKRHLTDPKWLMRVGLYLELLTCIGIFEAVKDDMGDLLTPAERAAYEQHPFFAEIRHRLNPKGWRKVWELRKISFPKFGLPQTGPVSSLNLLQKKRATLSFLQVHHDDLKHAIALAGKNEYNAP